MSEKMAMPLSDRQLTGVDDTHLVAVAGDHRLLAEAAQAFGRLQSDAAEAGFDLAIASSYRSFQRQLAIWNDKASGARAVHDDQGRAVAMDALSDGDKLRAILRFSALPGTSRHHWGTELDVYDASALPEGEQVQLVPAEVSPGGVFDPLHCWLDERMAVGESHGFFRPYGVDRGGVAPERWHLSYAPLSVSCGARIDAGLLRVCWDREAPGCGLLLREPVEAALQEILQRYVIIPDGWCPGGG